MSGIYKSYDIRGIYPDQLDESTARKIGMAIGEFLNTGTVVVGHDMREVAEPISDALVNGLLNTGQNVTDIGLCSTPMNYHATGTFNAQGGVMVTASHNPPEYIGFKISAENVKPVSYESGINTIEKAVRQNSFEQTERQGTYEKVEYLDQYVTSMLEVTDSTGTDSLNVAVDTGNGMGGLTVPEIFDRIPIQYTGLYLELDGSFPNHIPNPLEPENVNDLCEEVSQGAYDLGLAFDGDADRVVFVDEEGDQISADLVTALLAQKHLQSEPADTSIVYDLRSSKIVPETIRKNNGSPDRQRVGHVYMKEKMREVDAPFGGELSGHYYYRKNYYTDSGLLAALDVIDTLASSSQSLTELIEPFEKYAQSGEINFEVEDKQSLMQKLADHYTQGDVDWLDGVTITFPNWWFNVRPSNTEPLLRLNLEADTDELVREKVDEIRTFIERKTS